MTRSISCFNQEWINMTPANITQLHTPNTTDRRRPCLCVHVQYVGVCASAALCVIVRPCRRVCLQGQIHTKPSGDAKITLLLWAFCFSCLIQIFYYHYIWIQAQTHTHTLHLSLLCPQLLISALFNHLLPSLRFLAFLHLSFPLLTLFACSARTIALISSHYHAGVQFTKNHFWRRRLWDISDVLPQDAV